MLHELTEGKTSGSGSSHPSMLLSFFLVIWAETGVGVEKGGEKRSLQGCRNHFLKRIPLIIGE